MVFVIYLIRHYIYIYIYLNTHTPKKRFAVIAALDQLDNLDLMTTDLKMDKLFSTILPLIFFCIKKKFTS